MMSETERVKGENVDVQESSQATMPPVMATAYFFVFLGALFVTLCDSYGSFMVHNGSNDHWRYNEYAFYILLLGLSIHTVRLYVSLHDSDDDEGRFYNTHIKPLHSWQQSFEWSIRMIMVGVVTLKLLAGYEVDSQSKLAMVLFVFFVVLLTWDVVMASFLGWNKWREQRESGSGPPTGSMTVWGTWKSEWKSYYFTYALRDSLGFLALAVLWWTAPIASSRPVENDVCGLVLQLLSALSYTFAVLWSIGDDLAFLRRRQRHESRQNAQDGSSSGI